MEHIVMNEEILNIINAVLDYKKYIVSHNYVIPKEGFNWYKETQSYYNSLPLPEGMRKNIADFERVLSYGLGLREMLKKLNYTNFNDLCNYNWK